MTENVITILVIDDEPMIRQVFIAFLRQWGYLTLEAEDGRAGIELFASEKVDLVLTDLDMPVMGGLEVLEHIHTHSPETPVIIISGAGQLDDAVQSVKLGAWDYLTKPISNMGILENTIQRCLERVRLVRENEMYQKHLEDEVARKTKELHQRNLELRSEVAERRQKEEEVSRLNRSLEAIVEVSRKLFGYSTVRELMAGVMQSMGQLLCHDMGRLEPGMVAEDVDAFVIFSKDGEDRLVCGQGIYAQYTEVQPSSALSASLYERVRQTLSRAGTEFGEKQFFGFLQPAVQHKCVIFVDGCSVESRADRRLVTIYLNNIASALDSLLLQEEIIKTQKEVVITLGEVIETRSREAANHVRRVAEFAYLLARRYGLSKKEAMLLRFASPMHDAGKIGIPDAILHKPGKLNEQELTVMHDHAVLGYDILKNSQRQILQMAAIVAHEHHERWDGCGYPRGLAGESIHIYGRIVALADVFDALASKRCYKDAWPMDEVLGLIRRERAGHFDPDLVDILLEDLDSFLEIRQKFPDN